MVLHNCLGSSNLFQTLFSFLTSVESSHHIVALQDIPLWMNCRPVFRNYKCFFPQQLTAITLELQPMFMKGY